MERAGSSPGDLRQGDCALRGTHPNTSEPETKVMTFLPGLKVTGPLECATPERRRLNASGDADLLSPVTVAADK